jgi:ABC-type phosphate transport system substrate-binding protein
MRALGLTILLLTCLLATAAVAQPAPPAYVIVVNGKNPTTTVSRRFLSEAFLKKTTRWEGGELIRPVDQDPEAAVRRHFTEQVLRRSVTAVRSYWQQVIFAGRDVPPPELAGDGQVLDYVKRHPGAVGYVSATADTAGTKILAVR